MLNYPNLAIRTILTWSVLIEFEGLASVLPHLVHLVSAPKALSSFILTSPRSHLVRFLVWAGRDLNNWESFTWNVCSFFVCTAALADVSIFKTATVFPIRPPSVFTFSPQLGTRPSIVFQVYKIRYLSSLLWREIIFISFNCSQ